MTIEEACEILHDAYEDAAVGTGWETNPLSRVTWAEVPDDNKATMRAAVSALFAAFPLGYEDRQDASREYVEQDRFKFRGSMERMNMAHHFVQGWDAAVGRIREKAGAADAE